jgi:hypothetical protein
MVSLMRGALLADDAVRGILGGIKTGARKARAGSLRNRTGQRFRQFIKKSGKNPVKYGLPTAALGAEIGRFGYHTAIEPPAEAIIGALGAPGRAREAARESFAREDTIKAIQDRTRMVRESIRKNITYIAQSNPQLYNELVVGRRLPRGAVVLGGPPRRDLLEEVATMMAGAK